MWWQTVVLDTAFAAVQQRRHCSSSAEASSMDGLTLLLAMLGGLFNGTFPIFIKTEKVLAAKVHPVIFQLYKSSWVMIVGVCCAIVRLIRGLPQPTPWASLSAAVDPVGCVQYCRPARRVAPACYDGATGSSFPFLFSGSASTSR